MKKIISFVLVALLLVSAIPTVLATNDYTQGTQVVYTATGSEAYTITVPALLTPGSNGTVTLEGTWAENRIVTVTAEQTVTLTNSIKADDKKVLNVHFDGISEKGSNTGSQTFTEGVFVDDITNALFGTWNGTFYYNVEIANEASESGCDTLSWNGNTDGLVSVEIPEYDAILYRISDVVVTLSDCANGTHIVLGSGDEFDVTYEEILDTDSILGGLALNESMIVIPEDNYNNGEGIVFPKAGIYHIMYNWGENIYISEFTINSYAGFEHFDGCPHDNSGNVGKDEETPSTVGCDTLYWDGNTDGKLIVEDIFVKVSDSIVLMDDLKNGFSIYLNKNGEEVEATCPADSVAEWVVEFGDMVGFVDLMAICIASDNLTVEAGVILHDKEVVFPEKGVYLPTKLFWAGEEVPGEGTFRLTIPDYTGFPHSDKCGH